MFYLVLVGWLVGLLPVGNPKNKPHMNLLFFPLLGLFELGWNFLVAGL
jgi:hypothetical protein